MLTPVTPLTLDPESLARLDCRAPRYTSYPTAVEFQGGFDVDLYRQALGDLSPQEAVSVYLHLPFCKSLCYYCGCTMAVRQSFTQATPYLKRLHAEIRMATDAIGHKPLLQQLHLGGGTPNFLSNIQMAQLLQLVRDKFIVADNAEWAMEIDARTLTPATIDTYCGLGFNRFSLGVQDFDPGVQAAIHRIQPFEQVQAIYDEIRMHPGVGVNFDLIYGLPKQTLTTFTETLARVIQLRPDRIAVYNFAYLPELKPHQRKLPADAMPSSTQKFELYLLAVERLQAAGYRHIGMDHFALATDSLSVAQDRGRLYRNFQGYAVQYAKHVLGFGVSAIGRVGDVFVQNQRTLGGYQSAIDHGDLPLEKGLHLDADDKLRELVIQRLMCDFAIDFKAFRQRTGVDFVERFKPELAKLEPAMANGLVDIDAEGLRATPVGRHFIRNVAVAFDRYRYTQEETAFSRTV